MQAAFVPAAVLEIVYAAILLLSFIALALDSIAIYLIFPILRVLYAA